MQNAAFFPAWIPTPQPKQSQQLPVALRLAWAWLGMVGDEASGWLKPAKAAAVPANGKKVKLNLCSTHPNPPPPPPPLYRHPFANLSTMANSCRQSDNFRVHACVSLDPQANSTVSLLLETSSWSFQALGLTLHILLKLAELFLLAPLSPSRPPISLAQRSLGTAHAEHLHEALPASMLACARGLSVVHSIP